MSVTVEPELLELHETIAPPGPIRADGLVPIHIIRPGIGKGRGRHLYEASMLENEVARGRFNSWKMYLDHLDPAAKKKAGGMPRSIRDLGGVIKEVWWDGDVPANPTLGHGRGAVMGLAKPNRFMRSLIEDLPEAVGASISATATGVRPVQKDGQQVWLVEGINPRGSVDWVTEAGAGGRVVSLMEALEESWADDEEVFALLEGRTDAEVVEMLREEGLLDRPGIKAALLEAGDGDGKDDEDDADKMAEMVKKHMAAGMPRKMAMMAARKQMAEASDGDGKDDEGGADDAEDLAALIKKYLPKFDGNKKMATTAAKRELAASANEARGGGDEMDATELLQEALEDEGGRELLATAVKPIVEGFLREIVAPRLGELIEAALEDERELMQAESQATGNRRLELRDLRDTAHALINESRLPEPFKVELRGKYTLTEAGEPTPSLDVVEDDPAKVADGETAKSAAEKLRESVAADLAVKTEQFQASRPQTRVTGQGERAPETKKTVEEGGEQVDKKKSTGSPLTDYALAEAGVDVDEGLYAGIT